MLKRKLIRDLVRMRGTVLSISLAVASAVAAFFTLRGTYESLSRAQERYYSEQRFADVFVGLKRAPLPLVRELEAIPGVARTAARIVGWAHIPLHATGQPAVAQVVSMPESGRPALNGVHLTAGRMPAFGRDDEVVVSEAFARVHALAPGHSLPVTMEGHQKTLRIVGLGMSPEYVVSIPPGESAHVPARFAVLWLPRSTAEAAYGMQGAFNHLVVDLMPFADRMQVIRALDRALRKFGGTGAHGRDKQGSHFAVSQVLGQLAMFALVAPLAFLLVAAFLLHVALTRLVELERQQIATLKALGYGNRTIGGHYLQSAMVISLLGTLPGAGLGAWLGGRMTDQYGQTYGIPDLTFQFDLGHLGLALGACALAGALAAATSVRRAMGLMPAEAMRPPAPAPFAARGALLAVSRQLGSTGRMVLRGISKRPSATLLSALGVGLAASLIVVGQHFADKVHDLVDLHMMAHRRETLSVRFLNPVRPSDLSVLRAMPGVWDVQSRATMPVRVRVRQRERTVLIASHARRSSLYPLLDDQLRETRIARGSVVITDVLAQVLDVTVGSVIAIEPLMGDRKERQVRVSGTVHELAGMWVHMAEDDMAELLGTVPLAMEAALTIEREHVDAVQSQLQRMSGVLGSTRKAQLMAEARKHQIESTGRFALILTLFAMVIAGAVVYNDARVALSVRQLELSTLRVLGFTRREVAAVLNAELAIKVALALPVGLLIGSWIVRAISAGIDPELYRFPTDLSLRTLSITALAIAASSVVSALLVRGQIDRLDLVESLKSRE